MNLEDNIKLFKKDSYNYDLPKELIAQYPLEKRSSSKLMVLNRKTEEIQHKLFTDIIDFLFEGDVLVINSSKVIPARLYGEKVDNHILNEKLEAQNSTQTIKPLIIQTPKKIDILLLNKNTQQVPYTSSTNSRIKDSYINKRLHLDINYMTEIVSNEDIWQCLISKKHKLEIGDIIKVNDTLSFNIIDKLPEGIFLIKFEYDKKVNLIELIEKFGSIPLPNYISRKTNSKDKETYQTVFAREIGSVAAPTAGLHFTDDLVNSIKKKGVHIAEITLHVGLGTFRPVYADDIRNHNMHSEYCTIPQETADMINYAKRIGKKIISVGTTTTRTIESFAKGDMLEFGSKWTSIFFYPNKKFSIIDAQITNFHTPCSTLLMMIAAFAGFDFVMNAYHEAIKEKYRFFSYGDSMYIY